MKRYSGPLMLLLTAMIWGAAFVAQSVGMDYVGPFTFNSARNFLGAAVLIPFILIGDRRRTEPQPQKSWRNRELWLAGLICGVILAVATSLQQLGLIHTTVGKAGFITTLYVVLVPLLGLFVGKRVRGLMWLCVALAVAGLYFLCMSGSAALGVGAELIETYGPDSPVGRTAAVMLGSTETTFYTVAVYFGAVGVRRSRYAIPAALCADLTGFLAAAWSVRLLFGGT